MLTVPWSAGSTDEMADVIFGVGDLERDFVGRGACKSLCGSESDGCLAGDFDLDCDLLHFERNLDLIGDRDRDRRSLSLE